MKKLLVLLVTLIAVTACGTYRETVQIDDKAYLLLIGEPDGNVVTIDGGSPIELGVDTNAYDLNGKTATKIEISTGSHTVKVLKNGVLTVNRKFYVSNGTSFELQL